MPILKMDLGLSKRHLGQMDVEARLMADVAVRYNKPEVQNVLSNPQSRKKVLNLVERLMSRSATSLSEEMANRPPPEVIDTEGVPAVEEEAIEGDLLGENEDLDDENPLASPMPASGEDAS